MNVIFDVRGGIGKVIASTAVVAGIRKRHTKDKIIVVSPFPEIYKNNFNIDHNYHLDDISTIYNLHIKNQRVQYYAQEPYLTDGFLNREMDLVTSWYSLYDMHHINKENPAIYLDESEDEIAKRAFKTGNPILALHTHGGNEGSEYNWAKDLPDCVVEKVIEEFKDKYDIFHIKTNNQISYDNTIPANQDIRSIATLIKMSNKRLFIDSFPQHMARALYKKSTVCWIATSPKNFGYDYHDNILCNVYERETVPTHYQQYNLREDRDNLPFGDEERIFDVDKIIESIKKQ
tara:strand:+ start:276 stop:1142 length:867 start_codon:yes stop_codon:yes gene_type:complete